MMNEKTELLPWLEAEIDKERRNIELGNTNANRFFVLKEVRIKLLETRHQSPSEAQVEAMEAAILKELVDKPDISCKRDDINQLTIFNKGKDWCINPDALARAALKAAFDLTTTSLEEKGD